MATYRVEFRSSADRELSRLDRQVLERLVEAIDALGEQPRPVGVRKLAGAEHTYLAFRVQPVQYAHHNNEPPVCSMKG